MANNEKRLDFSRRKRPDAAVVKGLMSELLALREEGYPVTEIYQGLIDENLISMQYPSFRKCFYKLRKEILKNPSTATALQETGHDPPTPVQLSQKETSLSGVDLEKQKKLAREIFKQKASENNQEQ